MLQFINLFITPASLLVLSNLLAHMSIGSAIEAWYVIMSGIVGIFGLVALSVSIVLWNE